MAVGSDQWAKQAAGGLGLALDLYAADELRRAGYEADGVWPRSADPRTLPASASRAIDRLARSRKPRDPAITPAAWSAAKNGAIAKITSAMGTARAVVHGEFFPKEVDVIAADWDRGVELLISTKSMTGSYSKNLKNWWEEFVGDVRNIRGRFPLAALGVLFLVDHRILDKPQWERLLAMLRKLSLESEAGQAYDATALVVARSIGVGKAELLLDRVPPNLGLSQFFESMLDAVFTRLPVTERRAARAIYGRRELPTAEAAQPAEVTNSETG